MGRRFQSFGGALSLLLVVGACSKGERTVEPLSTQEPPKRAAASFVHCVEAQAAGCVQGTKTSGGAHALFVLSWLADGTPLSILASARDVLAKHADARAVKSEFVEQVERYATAIRGAECDPVTSRPAADVAKALATRARERLEKLGLLAPNAGELVDALAKEVEDELQSGHIVTMECGYDPYRLHLVTRQEGQLHEVVGLSTLFPELDGTPTSGALTPEQIEGRLQGQALGLTGAQAPIAEGTVHPYLPFPVEVL